MKILLALLISAFCVFFVVKQRRSHWAYAPASDAADCPTLLTRWKLRTEPFAAPAASDPAEANQKLRASILTRFPGIDVCLASECAARDALACLQCGSLEYLAGRADRGAQYTHRACELGYADACEVEKRQAKSNQVFDEFRARFRNNCTGGDCKECTRGYESFEKNDRAFAREIATIGCRKGCAGSCDQAR